VSRPKVVVCGTRFGRVYLSAFRDPELPFELAGVLARGGERSKKCADYYDVPLYTELDQLPGDIDIACVVVSGSINGGPGARLSQQLMERGLHVLQEHQLDEAELAGCLRVAKKTGRGYHLNTLYPHIEPVRRFIAAAREALRRKPLLYIEASASFPVTYSLLDIIGQAVGKIRPWRFQPAAVFPTQQRAATALDVPFRTIEGVLAGVPCTLRIQHQMDAGDPENHGHLFHRITLGTEGGALMLVNTHGPVLWSPRPRLPAELDDTVVPEQATSDYLRLPSTVPIGPAEAPHYTDIMSTMWPAGVGRALAGLHSGVADTARLGQYHLSITKLFRDVVDHMGPLDLQRRAYYTPLSADPLIAAAEAELQR
jgi:pyochelin biosynthetic protein PchG